MNLSMKKEMLWLHNGFAEMTSVIQKADPQNFALWVLS